MTRAGRRPRRSAPRPASPAPAAKTRAGEGRRPPPASRPPAPAEERPRARRRSCRSTLSERNRANGAADDGRCRQPAPGAQTPRARARRRPPRPRTAPSSGRPRRSGARSRPSARQAERSLDVAPARPPRWRAESGRRRASSSARSSSPAIAPAFRSRTRSGGGCRRSRPSGACRSTRSPPTSTRRGARPTCRPRCRVFVLETLVSAATPGRCRGGRPAPPAGRGRSWSRAAEPAPWTRFGCRSAGGRGGAALKASAPGDAGASPRPRLVGPALRRPARAGLVGRGPSPPRPFPPPPSPRPPSRRPPSRPRAFLFGPPLFALRRQTLGEPLQALLLGPPVLDFRVCGGRGTARPSAAG